MTHRFGNAMMAVVIIAGMGISATWDRTAMADDMAVRWNLASAYPGRMVQLGLLGKNLPKKLAAISDGKIRLRYFEPKALAPPLQYSDAVAKGAIDSAWTTPGYWYGKDRALVMFNSVPFGPSAGEYLASLATPNLFELIPAPLGG